MHNEYGPVPPAASRNMQSCLQTKATLGLRQIPWSMRSKHCQQLYQTFPFMHPRSPKPITNILITSPIWRSLPKAPLGGESEAKVSAGLREIHAWGLAIKDKWMLDCCVDCPRARLDALSSVFFLFLFLTAWEIISLKQFPFLLSFLPSFLFLFSFFRPLFFFFFLSLPPPSSFVPSSLSLSRCLPLPLSLVVLLFSLLNSVLHLPYE